MPTVAYIANQFPSPVEWYVVDEIRELRRRGVHVVPCSARRCERASLTGDLGEFAEDTLFLQPLQRATLARAAWRCLQQIGTVRDLLARVLFAGRESPRKRLHAVLHTFLGVYYAELLEKHGVEHIHVHHGYFASWIALVAARMLGIPFSLTLHGSDLLVQPTYMQTKLAECSFCLTISEFNRRHILAHYPGIDPGKIRVQRLGVKIPTPTIPMIHTGSSSPPPLLIMVGRLHAVKNHSFFLQACYLLRECGMEFHASIVGEGPERRRLEFLIDQLSLGNAVDLAGHLARDQVEHCYEMADLVVLTSHSEGIPLVLMEAMAHGKIVLAPAITGIPELVIDGKTGFLYPAGSLEEFVWRIEQICKSLEALDPVRRAAREHVGKHFNRLQNLESFADFFVPRINEGNGSNRREDLVLQQI